MLVFPDQTFFVPNPNFWKFMKEKLWVRYRRIYDIGAGSGRLTEALKARKYDVIGIDNHRRENQSSLVKIQDANDLWFSTYEDLGILARPCHGYGLDILLKNLFDRGLDVLLYIGLESNIENDLSEYSYETLATDVGKEGEVILRVYGPLSQAKPVVYLENSGWWNYYPRNRRVTNDFGAGFTLSEDDVILDEKNILHLDQLFDEDYNFDKKSNQGWISPKGEFFPCFYREHNYVAQKVLGVTEARLEELNFVRAYGDFYTHKDIPNKKQFEVLRNLNYSIFNFEEERSTE